MTAPAQDRQEWQAARDDDRRAQHPLNCRCPQCQREAYDEPRERAR